MNMPTKRTWSFLLIAVILYLMANQTQVGWIYVIVAGIAGLLLASFLYSRGMLKSIQVQRTLERQAADNNPLAGFSPHGSPLFAEVSDEAAGLTLPAFYEDDAVQVTLHFQNKSRRPNLLIAGQETCPFAPPPERNRSFFIPVLFKQQPVSLVYETYCDRRGLYQFPEISLRSNGPFGFFKGQHRLSGSSDLLVYPRYHPLKRLAALERLSFGQQQRAKIGPGGQVAGTREYRPGDPLRQVHWRSTARRGQLVVKEFLDDEQWSLTVVLDLAAANDLKDEKFSPFETAVRMAASLSYYASRQNIPFYLAGASRSGAAPSIPLSWWGSLTYLAKVRNDGQKPLADVLDNLPVRPLVVVLVSRPQPEIGRALVKLSRNGCHVLAVFITPEGVIPPEFQALNAPNLKLKGTTPGQWVETLESL